jgi:hypothetical protein
MVYLSKNMKLTLLSASKGSNYRTTNMWKKRIILESSQKLSNRLLEDKEAKLVSPSTDILVRKHLHYNFLDN